MRTKAYKLFQVRKDGSLGSLFINRKERIPIGKWLKSESHPTEGFVYRPGWHCVPKPTAPHLSLRGRKWFEIEVDQFKTIPRPKAQGEEWLLAKRMKVLREVI